MSRPWEGGSGLVGVVEVYALPDGRYVLAGMSPRSQPARMLFLQQLISACQEELLSNRELSPSDPAYSGPRPRLRVAEGEQRAG